MKKIEKFSFGTGDRFAHQGAAQLRAMMEARNQGIEVTPVWNKSHREHRIVGSQPDDLRAEADAAVAALGWDGAWHVDADHIGLDTVDAFLAGSDFFTLDVADFIGKAPDPEEAGKLESLLGRFIGSLEIEGIEREMEVTADSVRAAVRKFGAAAREAGRIHRYIAEHKGTENFITEVSVDETDAPQTPDELLMILAMLAGENVPVQTIAPKFTGRFNKGVDYVGNVETFEREFDEDLCVLAHAVREFGLPESLKLSVHSGSDKFSIYPAIRRQIQRHNAGLHVKTAGTTWLEELIGLAESGGDALRIAKEIYRGAFGRFDELTAPYATVIDIDRAALPDPGEVDAWDGPAYAAALRHVPDAPEFNPHFRQLLHVGFKIAAELGTRYTEALEANESAIARNVTENLLARHIQPLFG